MFINFFKVLIILSSHFIESYRFFVLYQLCMDLPSEFSDSYILPTILPIPPRSPAMYLETDVSIIPCCLVHLLLIKVRILTACCIKLAYFRTVYPGRYDRVFPFTPDLDSIIFIQFP